MVPNQKLFFFFTEDFDPLVSEDYPKISFMTPEEIVSFFFLLKKNLEMFEEDYKYTMESLNIFLFEEEAFQVISKDFDPQITIKPREKRAEYKPPKAKRKRKKWNWNTSIFRDFRRDNEKLLTSCFEFDWNAGRLESFLKDEEEKKKIKKYLRSVYLIIKDAYRYYSSYSGMTKLMCIGPNNLLELLKEIGALNENDLSTAAVGIEMNKTNFSDKKFMNNPKGAICRHEFLELMVRLAENKYYSNKIVDTYYDATVKFFGNFLSNPQKLFAEIILVFLPLKNSKKRKDTGQRR